MDLLFKQYASPFLMLDEIIANCEFDEWMTFFIKKHNDEMNDKSLWELYLHKDFESESFIEFKNRMTSDNNSNDVMNEAEKEKIIEKSQNILDGFFPERKG